MLAETHVFIKLSELFDISNIMYILLIQRWIKVKNLDLCRETFYFQGKKHWLTRSFVGVLVECLKFSFSYNFLNFDTPLIAYPASLYSTHVLMKKMHRNLYISRGSTLFEDFVRSPDFWDLGFVCKYGIYTDSMSAHDARIVS